MIAIAIALAVAAQPAPAGWTERELGNSTAYEKDGSVVVMMEPRRLDPEPAMTAAKAAAARVPGCAGLADAPLEGDSGGYMVLAADEVFCALYGVPLKDGRFQTGVIVVPRAPGQARNPAFDEAGQVFAEIYQKRQAWLSGPEAATVRGQGPAPAAQAAPAGPPPATLQAALDAVPAANVPVHTVIHGYGTHVGWPPSYIYRVFPVFLFEGGRGHACPGADPMRLDWAALAADEDCDVYEWRPRGAAVEFREVGDDEWESQQPQTDRKFGDAERLDVRFENRGGTGVDYGAGSMAVSTLTGKNLIMTRDGRIVVTGYSTTLASGPSAVASASGKTRPIQGTYLLKGSLIAIQEDGASAPTVAYIAADTDKGVREVGHVFFGGTHYWNPDD